MSGDEAMVGSGAARPRPGLARGWTQGPAAEARLKKWLSAGKLDRQMAECFVEEVRVFEGRRLEASLLGREEILRRMER